MQADEQIQISKPRLGDACNGCGYCCSVAPCMLAEEFLHYSTGPCVALEKSGGKFICGLVRNPLGYLFKAAQPDADVDVLGEPPAIEEGYRLSVSMANALGVGRGCDATDDDQSAAWPILIPTINTDKYLS